MIQETHGSSSQQERLSNNYGLPREGALKSKVSDPILAYGTILNAVPFSPCEIVSRSVFCRCAGAEAKAQSFAILYDPIKSGPDTKPGAFSRRLGRGWGIDGERSSLLGAAPMS